MGYVGAGTVEFIVPGDNADSFSFMEMNTRLQVEHPVTEMITGLDLVELQIAVADGQQLPFTQDEIGFDGHAVEARIYAEDPAHDFLPSAGILGVVDLPGGDGVRVDSGVESGATVGVDYDPMLAKVIAYGADRATALRRVDAALARTSILGVHTNIGLLRALLVDSDVRSGHLDTGLIESRLESLGDQAIPAVVPIVAALLDRLGREPGGAVVDPFDIPSGFRVGGPSTEAIAVEIDRQRYDVQIRGRAASASVCGSGGEFVAASIARDGDRVTVRVGDRVVRLRCFVAPDASVWLGLSGRSWRVGRVKRDAPRASGAGASTRADLRSPMPGTVTVVHADVGAAVRTGDPIVVVEAMKMEHVLAAPFDGVIADLPAQQGDRVALDALLATVEAGS
ncbi:MAG: biotin/lipoyl-containing protein [Mycobacteriales bacterium]